MDVFGVEPESVASSMTMPSNTPASRQSAKKRRYVYQPHRGADGRKGPLMPRFGVVETSVIGVVPGGAI